MKAATVSSSASSRNGNRAAATVLSSAFQHLNPTKGLGRPTNILSSVTSDKRLSLAEFRDE